jgi:hypothetical protein
VVAAGCALIAFTAQLLDGGSEPESLRLATVVK